MANDLELKMSRLDIRCDHLSTLPGRLPKSTTDSLIQQVREVITAFYIDLIEREGSENGNEIDGTNDEAAGSSSQSDRTNRPSVPG
jgi:hypothetical protein